MTECLPKCCTNQRYPNQTERQIIVPLSTSEGVQNSFLYHFNTHKPYTVIILFYSFLHNLQYLTGAKWEGCILSKLPDTEHDTISSLWVQILAFRGCYDNLNDAGAVCCRLCGVTLPSQTWGTQDKRSQSKGDVEVMKTKALRGRELLETAVMLSTSDLLSPSSTARRISWPSLYGNLAPHENTHTYTNHEDFYFPQLKK